MPLVPLTTLSVDLRRQSPSRARRASSSRASSFFASVLLLMSRASSRAGRSAVSGRGPVWFFGSCLWVCLSRRHRRVASGAWRVAAMVRTRATNSRGHGRRRRAPARRRAPPRGRLLRGWRGPRRRRLCGDGFCVDASPRWRGRRLHAVDASLHAIDAPPSTRLASEGQGTPRRTGGAGQGARPPRRRSVIWSR